MYSFLRRPAWIVSHVLVALLVASLVTLGFWQRERWITERDKSEQLEARARAEPRELDDVVDPGADPGSVPESVRYTRVRITGTYDPDAEVAILNRSQNGSPGAWVLTPLVRGDGTAVAVVRGWIPYDPAGEEPPFPGSLPPEGQVTVTGNVQLTQVRGSVGPIDAPDGVLPSLARVDLERYARQLGHDLAPVWVLLDEQEPPQPGRLPQLVDLQTQDPSQNFSYMVQWWIFALIAAGGYPLVLRAVARSRARGEVPAEGPPPGDDPAHADRTDRDDVASGDAASGDAAPPSTGAPGTPDRPSPRDPATPRS